MDWHKLLLAFIFDRYIEEGNFHLIRGAFKNLSDEEFINLEAAVEEVYADYQNIRGK